MLIRALMVLLVFLNLGVAGWWLVHAEPVPGVPPQPAGVAMLQLAPTPAARASGSALRAAPAPVSEPAPAAASVGPEAVAAAEAPATAPAPAVCLALGPFADEAAARAALGRLQPAPGKVNLRSEVPPAKAYSVLLPPLADRAAAQAMTERIAAAGFTDFMIINAGASANGVALGRYGSLESAERRQAEMKAHGLPAGIQPVGQIGATRWWLDVALTAAKADAARSQAQAARAEPRDCG